MNSNQNNPQRFGIENHLIKKILDIFKKYQNIKKIILFGSRALGNFKHSSDIDICLVGDNINLTELSLIENEIDDLSLPWKFDLIIYSLIDNQKLKEHIERDGIEIT